MKIKRFTIKNISDKRALLKAGDFECVWPADELPEGAAEGTEVYICLSLTEPTNEETAKAILNEVLKDH